MPDDKHNLKEIQYKINSLSSTVDELHQEKNEIISSIERKTISGIKKRFSFWIGGGILSLILMYFTISYLVTSKSADYIANSITEKFAEPKIAQTLNEVAQNQAQKIIENNLNPAIQEATSSVNQKIEIFDKDLQEFKYKNYLELKKLAKEVGYFKNRNEVLKLSDAAIATGDAAPFEELGNIYNSSTDEDIKMIALAEIFRVKNQFATMTRIKGIDVKYTHPQTGKEFIENEIPTEALLQGLKKATPWQYRARIAQLLKRRKEKQVPEALLEAIRSDKKLEVRKEALDSFQSITGFTSRDVFRYDAAKEWWEENKKDLEKNLKELQTIEEVIQKNSKN